MVEAAQLPKAFKIFSGIVRQEPTTLRKPALTTSPTGSGGDRHQMARSRGFASWAAVFGSPENRS